ncbi:hypothetical protein SCLCIDRAFT_1215568 [Scleroderma citrinum Foug A]|uniref:Uncharacterized protein n=1 Tax=Scleroderma citrinum Foug A TaxID=1036808 RepID=A0A0C3E1I0_9AGAM|nr:hypothetical protein SCLCIDRAFT_1215568 [Scleroderma citrinum Foug A]
MRSIIEVHRHLVKGSLGTGSAGCSIEVKDGSEGHVNVLSGSRDVPNIEIDADTTIEAARPNSYDSTALETARTPRAHIQTQLKMKQRMGQNASHEIT